MNSSYCTESDLRIVVMQQRISGSGHGTEAGATNDLTTCSSAPTVRKQSLNLLAVLRDLFESKLFLPSITQA